VVPEQSAVERFAEEKHIKVDDYDSLLTTTPIKNLITREIETATGHLADHEKVTRFTLLAEPFAVENDLLTPTLKLRRSKIAERYRDTIAAMYR
jgi:long-chain acyl-CoA synthetase